VKRALALVVVFAGAGACAPTQQYTYRDADGGPERRLPETRAEVVSRAHAEATLGAGTLLSIPFGPDGDSSALVADFLGRADASGAAMVSDLAIYLLTAQDGAMVECRTEILPETVTSSHWRPAHTQTVSVQRPVTRRVTDYEYKCHTTYRSQSRSVTEYERSCHTVSRPVTRTRTTYRSSYDSYSKSYRSQPHTESYTTYESKQECSSRPVTRYRTEQVPHRDCRSEPVTRTVTRYEFQLENRYVPGRLETLSRQRLRELDPVCYAAPGDVVMAPGASGGGNRIEGLLHAKR
jgi:hypothetical protein